MSRRDSTGDAGLDADIERLLDDVDVRGNRRLHRQVLVAGLRLAADRPARLDLKIAAAALEEMRRAFEVFAPYADRPKVTVFGSARTREADSEYRQAHDLTKALAAEGWMVVTGAGPGIMQAASEGAGRDVSIGVSIRLPFETEVNDIIAGNEKLVSMKYFFTRKLMLVKESKGFVSLPGGFGTLDETFELLTLQQTGKADPAPIVMLDIPGGRYWRDWSRFNAEVLVPQGLISPSDLDLYAVTASVNEARQEITDFWRNYHSIRYVGANLVVRMHRGPDADELAAINTDFAHLTDGTPITETGPLPVEVDDDDELSRDRLLIRYGPGHYGRLRGLVDRINSLGGPIRND